MVRMCTHKLVAQPVLLREVVFVYTAYSLFECFFFFKKKGIFENVIYYHRIYITYTPCSLLCFVCFNGWLSLFLGSGYHIRQIMIFTVTVVRVQGLGVPQACRAETVLTH